jgi:hypothetical protein
MDHDAATANVTYEDLCAVSQNGLVGLEQYFINAEQQYGVNCVFLMSIAGARKRMGHVTVQQNNLFGFGQYDLRQRKSASTRLPKRFQPNLPCDDGIYYSGKTINAVWTRYCDQYDLGI